MTATAKATIHTNHGDIVVNLFGNHAPLTVKNFIGLSDGTQEWRHPRTGEVQEGPLYKDVIFHRIIRDFMIQGGDPLGQGIGGPGYQFKDEIHPELSFNKPYLLAPAPTAPSSSSPPLRPPGSTAATPSSVRSQMRTPRRSLTPSKV